MDSKQFKFLVGEAGKALYIHASLATQHSITLATLIEGGMVETAREYAILDDVDEETFVRFIQFAYTGQYSVAAPDLILAPSDIGSEATNKNGNPHTVADEKSVFEVDPDSGWGAPGPQSAFKDKKLKKKKDYGWVDNRFEPAPAPFDARSKGTRLWDAFKAKACVTHTEPWRPTANTDHCEDYTPVFLCHAKLYVFSDKYSIEPLRNLVLQKLRLNLSEFKLHPQRIGDIVELLKYVYEHTSDYEDGIDCLRNLICDYVVCHIEKIVAMEDFTKLLQENGDVSKDLMPKLMQRLN